MDATPQSEIILNETTPVFGGKHTSEKLEIVFRYAEQYRKVLKNQKFTVLYIDAFAGAGYYRPREKPAHPDQGSFDEFKDEGVERLIEGSARRVLQIDPPFDHYVYVEANEEYAKQLEELKTSYPHLENNIKVRCEDANEYLRRIARKNVWKSHRALVFLDPYGMQVEWETIAALARTQAIDVWYLFPVGIGVGRLLESNGRINKPNRMHLDRIFGTTEWEQAFYQVSKQGNLFSAEHSLLRTGNTSAIEEFFINRLRSVFAAVAERPYRLFSSRGSWLYSMCFAAGNPKGSRIALKIADYILKEKPWQRVRASSGRR